MLAKFEGRRANHRADRQDAGQRKAAEQAQRRVAKLKRELREEFADTVLSTQDDARQGELRRPKVEEGSRVRLKGIREPARVRRRWPAIDGSGGRLHEDAGVDRRRAGSAAGRGGRRKLPKNVSFRPAPELNPVHQEINVIGQRAEEARDHVEQFLDRAVMATASRVRIVHGHGMGILRKVLWELLKNPHVEKYYQAPQQEGGAGATIVELKE